jgi:hypothetical protein
VQGGSSSLETAAALQLAQQLRASGLLLWLREVMVDAVADIRVSVAVNESGNFCAAVMRPGTSDNVLSHSSALLHLACTVIKMWPGGAVRSNDVAPIIDPAAELALCLIRAAALPHQTQAGVRADVLLRQALVMTHCTAQQLAAPLLLKQLQTEGTVNSRDRLHQIVHSLPFMQLLLLLLLEVQLHQTGLVETNTSSSCSSAGSSSSSSIPAEQQQWSPGSTFKPKPLSYTERLQDFFKFSPGQLGRADYRSSGSSSSSNAAAGCVATLQLLAALLKKWQYVPPGMSLLERLEQLHLPPGGEMHPAFQDLLSKLPIRLLQLAGRLKAASSTFTTTTAATSSSSKTAERGIHNSSSDTSRSSLASAVVLAAEAAAFFVPPFICIYAECSEQLLQVLTEVLSLHLEPAATRQSGAAAAAAAAAGAAETTAAGVVATASAATAEAESETAAEAAVAVAAAQEESRSSCCILTSCLNAAAVMLRSPRPAISNSCRL